MTTENTIVYNEIRDCDRRLGHVTAAMQKAKAPKYLLEELNEIRDQLMSAAQRLNK